MPHISDAQIQVLQSILKRLDMEDLDTGNDMVLTITGHPGGYGGTGERSERADEFIKRRTRNWREIWLIRPLERLLADLGVGGASGYSSLQPEQPPMQPGDRFTGEIIDTVTGKRLKIVDLETLKDRKK